MWTWLLLAATAVASFLLTGVMRRYALKSELLDHPNERSSHSSPTPRGGGIAIVTAVLGAWLAAYFADTARVGSMPILLVAATLIAVIGFADDRRHVPAQWRMLIHLLCAGLIAASTGGLTQLALPWGSIPMGWLGTAIATLYIAWVVNLYNFMDGIDGIAAVEAVTVSAGAGLLLLFEGQPTLALTAGAIGAAAAGFLVWNWPPAKIFMGDVGSSFIGFAIGALAIISHQEGALDIFVWSILLGVFIVDATITLIRRIARRERIYEAHKSHAYQHAVPQPGSHAPVTVAVGLLNLVWLLPLATLVATDRLPGLYGLLIAYAPLVWLALRYNAGLDHS